MMEKKAENKQELYRNSLVLLVEEEKKEKGCY